MTDEELSISDATLDALVKQAMDRAIERLQKLHSHAGRPAWDQVICEELSKPFTTLRAQLAEANARADRAEAALAAQSEADAKMIERIVTEARQEVGSIKLSKVDAAVVEMLSGIAKAIRNQPHDRTALDRHDAKTREKALRDAVDALRAHPASRCSDNDVSIWFQNTILALITKGDCVIEKEKAE